MSIIVEPNSSTNVTVTSSEGIASLTQKAEILGLNLVPANSETLEPSEPNEIVGPNEIVEPSELDEPEY